MEAMKMYADPSYIPHLKHVSADDSSRFGVGTLEASSFTSDLHSIEIRKQRRDSDQYHVIDFDEHVQTLSQEKFEELINASSDMVRTVAVSSSVPKKFQFNVYEGLCLDGPGNVEMSILNIYKTLVESEKKFHQVLFTVAAPSQATWNSASEIAPRFSWISAHCSRSSTPRSTTLRFIPATRISRCPRGRHRSSCSTAISKMGPDT
jgi:hypothetical protein